MLLGIRMSELDFSVDVVLPVVLTGPCACCLLLAAVLFLSITGCMLKFFHLKKQKKVFKTFNILLKFFVPKDFENIDYTIHFSGRNTDYVSKFELMLIT
jgi:hypothetical protein